MIHRVAGSAVDGKLGISWMCFDTVKALSVSVATDIEFLTNERTFVVPPIQSILLDVGPGAWWIRVGAWDGTDAEGRIEWSGIQGPIPVLSTKPTLKEQDPAVVVIHTQAIQGGLRFHTTTQTPVWAILESSSHPRFPASSTKTRYMFDWGRGYVDCMGLQSGTLYSVRLRTFGPDSTTLPTGSVKQVSRGIVTHRKQSAKPLRLSSATDTTVRRGDEMLLRDAKETPHVRFPSHTFYLKHKAALEKHKEERQDL